MKQNRNVHGICEKIYILIQSSGHESYTTHSGGTVKRGVSKRINNKQSGISKHFILTKNLF